MSNARKKLQFFAPYNLLSERSIGSSFATQNRLIENRFKNANNLFRKDLRAHFGCVNAIEFSHGAGEWIVSGGDDRRVLLWNVEKAMDNFGSPTSMKGEHRSNIFCMAFDDSNRKIFSGGNDEQVIVHDATTGEALDVFLHDDAVYGLSVDPVNSNVFASACDDGRVLIYDTRAPSDEETFCLANYNSPMHAVMFNPAEPRLVATANSREGLGLWDVRKPRCCLVRYGGSLSRQSCMSVRISRNGEQVLGLRRRLPPVVYNIHSPLTLFQFDHSGYYNSCTMKSCCFAGDKDQYIISGSDDFNLYVWKIPEEGCKDWVGDAHLILHGHRSIVNQVRFNPANHMIISSGVEKIVKVWSPFPLLHGSGDLGLCPETDERQVYTHEQYINLVLRSGQLMTHDYSMESMDEDPRMMAFFDSLVQRELEGWSSEDSLSSRSPIHDTYVQSDSSLRSSPNVMVDHVNSIAADAVLRFFSPINAITNRSTTNHNTDSNRVTLSNLVNPGSDNLAINIENSSSEIRTILDMDNQTSSTINDLNAHSNEVSNSNQRGVLLTLLEERINRSHIPGTSTTSVNYLSSLTRDSPNNVQSTIVDQIVEQSSESVDLDAPSTSGADADLNNRAASYKSISDLIQQKRKDYLVSIKRLERRATRRKIRYLSRRKEKLKRIRKQLLSDVENKDSSESDSDECEVREKTFLSSGTSSDSDSATKFSVSSTSSDHSSQNNTGLNIVNEIIEKRKNTIDRIQKFKKLRKRVLNSDSSDNEEVLEKVVTTETNGSDPNNALSFALHFPSVTPCSSNEKNTDTNAICCFPVYEDISNDSCQGNDTVSIQNESGIGAENSNNLITPQFKGKTSGHDDHKAERIPTDTLPLRTECLSSVSNGISNYTHSVSFLPDNKQLHQENESIVKANDDTQCNGCSLSRTNGNVNSISSNELSSSSSLVKIHTENSVLSNGGNNLNGTKENTVFQKSKEKQKVNKRNYRRRDSNDDG